MSNQAFFNQDTSKIFIWGNRTAQFEYNNATYDEVEIPAGTLMGQISATGRVVPLASGASDGSQFPIGILFEDSTIDAGETQNLALCVEGDVVQEKVIFQGSDDMDTVVSGRTLFARIGSDTVGIKLVPSTELTTFDNPDNAL